MKHSMFIVKCQIRFFTFSFQIKFDFLCIFILIRWSCWSFYSALWVIFGLEDVNGFKQNPHRVEEAKRKVESWKTEAGKCAR